MWAWQHLVVAVAGRLVVGATGVVLPADTDPRAATVLLQQGAHHLTATADACTLPNAPRILVSHDGPLAPCAPCCPAAARARLHRHGWGAAGGGRGRGARHRRRGPQRPLQRGGGTQRRTRGAVAAGHTCQVGAGTKRNRKAGTKGAAAKTGLGRRERRQGLRVGMECKGAVLSGVSQAAPRHGTAGGGPSTPPLFSRCDSSLVLMLLPLA